MKTTTLLLLATLLLAPLASLQAADLKLASVFSDHMVLQRERPVAVWGWADAGEAVTVSFAGQSKSTIAASDGKWMLKLDALKASVEPLVVTVNGKDDRKVEVMDVLVGEVWLCAGQSNMAMTVNGPTKWLHVGGIADATAVVRDSANSLLRQFLVTWKTELLPQPDCTGKWLVAGPETTAEFSATSYFFARELQRRLEVPVGVLNASFGGSSVEGWTSREALKKHSDAEFAQKMDQLIWDYEHHDQRLAQYADALAKWEIATRRGDPNGSSDDNQFATQMLELPDWRTVSIPASLKTLGLPDGGVIWLRRDIEIPAEYGSNWRLDFPACQAFYTIYLNGSKIFEATPTNELSASFSRPGIGRGIAKPGKNTLAIKLHAYSGKSGITAGSFAVVPFNPKQATIPLTGDWLSKTEAAFPALARTAEKMPAAPVKGTLHWMPVPSQFNAMLHPLIPYGIKGVAWYQGESNVGNSRYAKHLHVLVNDWRQRWGIGDFPFYSCQLAAFGPRGTKPAESRWAECREMQTTVLDLPNTGLVNLIDTCEDGDLHPLNKQDAGKRLALVALANTYDVNTLVWSGPVFDKLSIRDGKAVIAFRHTAGGLVAKPLPRTYRPNLRQPELPAKPLELPTLGSELQGFTLCDASRNWVNAKAKIEGTTVVVWSEEIKEPVAVRYAWADHPVCNLYNQAGLPAFPFRTDTHPMVSKPIK
jgi:sialate O-acetylesterase